MELKVLIVDDDENILAGYRRRLKNKFSVFTSASGPEALKLFSSHGPFHVVVSDLRMDEMDGFNFLAQVNHINSSTVCIMLTGHAELETSIEAFNQDYIFRFLTKPCRFETMEKAINEAGEKYFKNISENENSIDSIKNSTKRILIVSDDETTQIISTTFPHSDEIEILIAENTEIALNILNTIKINVIVINALIAQQNSCELLKIISKNHPEIYTAVTTWCVTKELREKIQPFGVNKFLEKPVSPDILSNGVINELHKGPKGIIDGISIQTFLQMIEMEEKTCTLKMRSNGNTGTMYFKKGFLINAELDENFGEEAALSIINWEKAAIEIENYCLKDKRMINKPLMGLLMEAAKVKDHQ